MQQEAINFLHRLKFFNRFEYDEFQTQVFPFIKLKKYKDTEILYPSGRYIHIVILGEFILKSHEGAICPPKITARFREGDVIGCDFDIPENLKQTDNDEPIISETLKVENW